MARIKRDYDFGEWTYKEVESLIDQIQELTGEEATFYTIEGSLQDNYLVYVGDVKFKYGVHREWLIARENYLNCWSSDLKVILTDNEKKADEFIEEKDRIEEEKEREEEEAEKRIKEQEAKKEEKSKKENGIKKAAAILGVCGALLTGGVSAVTNAINTPMAAAAPVKIESPIKPLKDVYTTRTIYRDQDFKATLKVSGDGQNAVLSTQNVPDTIKVHTKETKKGGFKWAKIILNTDKKIKGKKAHVKNAFFKRGRVFIKKCSTKAGCLYYKIFIKCKGKKTPYDYGYNLKHGKTDGINFAIGQDVTD